jgi:hypothetical protein
MTVNNFTARVSGDFATASNWSLGGCAVERH